MTGHSSGEAVAKRGKGPPGRAKLRRKPRVNQRGSVYVEYLIVTITVSFAAAAAIVKLGPVLLQYHREVVTTVIEKAP